MRFRSPLTRTRQDGTTIPPDHTSTLLSRFQFEADVPHGPRFDPTRLSERAVTTIALHQPDRLKALVSQGLDIQKFPNLAEKTISRGNEAPSFDRSVTALRDCGVQFDWSHIRQGALSLSRQNFPALLRVGPQITGYSDADNLARSTADQPQIVAAVRESALFAPAITERYSAAVESIRGVAFINGPGASTSSPQGPSQAITPTPNDNGLVPGF